jgi:hypothetical protein
MSMCTVAHAAAPSTCTVLLAGTQASVSCTGPAGAVSVAPAPRGFRISGKNVRLEDRGCVAMPRTKAAALLDGGDTAGTAAVAMLRVCAAGPLILTCRVSRVKVLPSGDAAVALSVVAAGDLTLLNSGAEGVRGGTAVHLAAGGDVYVVNSTFVKNHAAAGSTSLGGGLAVVASVGTRLVSFEGNAFRGNAAGMGGGAWVDIRAMRLGGRCLLADANHFDGCQASREVSGGALYVNATLTSGVAVDVAGTANFSRNRGGALCVRMDSSTGGKVAIHGDALFTNNTALEEVGVVVYLNFWRSFHGTAFIQGHTSFQGNTAGYGGAVCLDFSESSAGTATIAGNTSFQANIAAIGGAAFLDFSGSSASTATIEGNASFQGNTAASEGGAAYLDLGGSTNGNATISGTAHFIGNFAEAQGGAAVIDCQSSISCSATIAGNITFIGNTADIGGGVYAAVYDADAVQFKVEGAEFTNNTAISGGGGMVVYANTSREASISVQYSRFSGNTVAQGSGGGLVVVAGPPTDMDNNTVLFNVSTTTFTNNTVHSGTVGGLHVDGTSNAPCWLEDYSTADPCPATAELHRVQFDGNSATLGGGMFAINTQCAISSSTFTSNTASQAGGGAFTKGVTSMLFQEVYLSSNRWGPTQCIVFFSDHTYS